MKDAGEGPIRVPRHPDDAQVFPAADPRAIEAAMTGPGPLINPAPSPQSEKWFGGWLEQGRAYDIWRVGDHHAYWLDAVLLDIIIVYSQPWALVIQQPGPMGEVELVNWTQVQKIVGVRCSTRPAT